MPLGDALAVPYWVVRCVHDTNIANMRQSSMACTLEVGAGGEAADQTVNLPIMHNVKALKAGDELVLFVEPSLPSSMPVQTLEQVTKTRPVAATGRMQQTANKKEETLTREWLPVGGIAEVGTQHRGFARSRGVVKEIIIEQL